MSARRNDARDTLQNMMVSRTVAHGDKTDMKDLQKGLDGIIGVRSGDVKGLDAFLSFAGKGL